MLNLQIVEKSSIIVIILEFFAVVSVILSQSDATNVYIDNAIISNFLILVPFMAGI